MWMVILTYFSKTIFMFIIQMMLWPKLTFFYGISKEMLKNVHFVLILETDLRVFLKFLFLQVSPHIQEALMTDWDYIFVNIYVYSSAVERCTDIHRAMNGRTSAAYGRPSGDGWRIYIVKVRNVSLLFIFYSLFVLFVTNNTQYH